MALSSLMSGCGEDDTAIAYQNGHDAGLVSGLICGAIVSFIICCFIAYNIEKERVKKRRSGREIAEKQIRDAATNQIRLAEQREKQTRQECNDLADRLRLAEQQEKSTRQKLDVFEKQIREADAQAQETKKLALIAEERERQTKEAESILLDFPEDRKKRCIIL